MVRVSILLAMLLSSMVAFSAPAPLQLRDFLMTDIHGNSRPLDTLARDTRYLVLVFHTIGCPALRRSYPALERLSAKYKSVARFYLVNASPQDTLLRMQDTSSQMPPDLAMLKDQDQSLAKALGVRASSTVVVIDRGTGSVEYQGAISDQISYDQSKPKAAKAYLDDALSALVAGKPVLTRRTRVFGCYITFKS